MGGKNTSSMSSSVSELMVYVILCLLREITSQRSQREAQCLSCFRLPCFDGHLHCFRLSTASLGFATWSQDPLPELGTQNLKVPLSLEPWSWPQLRHVLLPLKLSISE